MRDNFLNLLDLVEQEIQEINQSNIIYNPDESVDDNYGVIYDHFEKENLFIKSTNFTKTIILDLYLLFSQFFSKVKVRGKKQRQTIIYRLLLILTFYRQG